jgi:hydroxyacylglutathione hydrolase
MKIEQIYTGCLAQGAYYIESKGEVAIIDPLREVNSYLQKAKKDNAKIKYIFETHFHADFVSGHVTLSEATGAPIVYGPNAKTGFETIIAKDGQTFALGEISITLLHTPGHTMESSCYLLKDTHGNAHALFSGDTLFLGDVGRPDLAQKGADLTQEDLAGMLYDSLRNKIMPLPDTLIIYPAHGAGSACGKNLSKETVGTLGEQKKTNYALRENMTKADFISEVTEGLLPPPKYFPLNVKMNKYGYEDVAEVLKKGTAPIGPQQFEELANEMGAIVLDVRHQDEYAQKHIPRSVFIGIDGGFAPWVGTLIGDVKQPLLLVTPKGREEETVTRLARVGFDNTLGFLEGGIAAWEAAGKETDFVVSQSALNFKNALEKKTPPAIYDVRKTGEFQAQHLPNASHTPLDFLNDHLNKFPKNESFYIHCAGGYRSMIAASILKSRGIHNLIDIKGGFAAIEQAGIETTAYVCPTSLK